MLTPASPLLARDTRWRAGLWLGGLSAAILLLLWRGDLFAQTRLRLNDIYFTPQPTSGSAVIVAIDDASLDTYGRILAEWPRTIYTTLMHQVSGARVVAFDLLFDVLKSNDDTLATTIQQARAGEPHTRTIMPIVAVQRVLGDGVTFQDAMRPNFVLAAVVDNMGSVNTFQDIDGVIRRQPGHVRIGDEDVLSFSIAAYLAYLRVPTEAIPQLVYQEGDTLHVTPQRAIFLDSLGLWQQNFYSQPLTVSLRDVLSGDIDPATFADKIVLVGLMNASGFIDQYPVPVDTAGNLMAGVEIHAHAVESLIQNQLPRPITPILAIIVLSIVSSAIYVYTRWYLLLPSCLLFILLLGGVAFATFDQRHEMIDLFYTELALIVPLLFNAARKLNIEIDRRRRSEFLLQSVVEISNQRLVLDRILPSIAADMRRVLTSPVGAIWLLDDERSPPRLACKWPESLSVSYIPVLENVCRRSRAERRAVISYPYVAVPVLWQGRLLAVLTAQLPLAWRPPRASLNLLQNLADQVAPSLENAILYTQVSRHNVTLEAILSASPSGIALLDSDLKPVRHNAAFDVAAPDLAVLNEHFQSGEAFRREIQIDESTYNLEAVPLPDLKQWVVILNDVTALSELNRFKTQMIRMASHDLRNPLSRILGYTSLILDTPEDPVPPQPRRFISSILAAAQQMNDIITGILDLELARTNSANYEPIDLPKIVEQVIEHHRADMTVRHQVFTADVRELTGRVSGSPRQISQAVTNLLSNAVKYTPNEGRITLRLYQTDDSALRLEIEDTGYGIPEEAQKKLFTEFYRVRTRATADIPGTGLGLSLVKSVITAHKGRIWVKSQEGAGSTFFVELPIIKD